MLLPALLFINCVIFKRLEDYTERGLLKTKFRLYSAHVKLSIELKYFSLVSKINLHVTNLASSCSTKKHGKTMNSISKTNESN